MRRRAVWHLYAGNGFGRRRFTKAKSESERDGDSQWPGRESLSLHRLYKDFRIGSASVSEVAVRTMLDLYEELSKLIAEFDRHQIDYALCGGIALAIYDHPRATVDIDLLILSESLDDVMAIAKALDYTIRGLDMTFTAGAVEIRRVSKIDSETGIVLSLDLLLVTNEIRPIWDSRVQ